MTRIVGSKFINNATKFQNIMTRIVGSKFMNESGMQNANTKVYPVMLNIPKWSDTF